ncbi:hypothetical protein [Streptomyces sp. NPDC093589]|uniref:hypothetical protein n=1 Tax=Streptomyces sp. NPDC093589 TaxID=3366043 RepID=UPI003809C7CA
MALRELNPPHPVEPTPPKKSPTPLARHWKRAWAPGGFLHRRWDEILQARSAGWHGQANWIKTTLAAAGAAGLVLLLSQAGDALHEGTRMLAPAVDHQALTEGWATIEQPVRHYLNLHVQNLPTSPAVLHGLWRTSGLLFLLGGFLTRSSGLRLGWATWGALTVGMVWAGTPDPGRPVAAGLAAVAWALASAFALRGLGARPSPTPVFHHTLCQPQVMLAPTQSRAPELPRSHPDF